MPSLFVLALFRSVSHSRPELLGGGAGSAKYYPSDAGGIVEIKEPPLDHLKGPCQRCTARGHGQGACLVGGSYSLRPANELYPLLTFYNGGYLKPCVGCPKLARANQRGKCANCGLPCVLVLKPAQS